MPPATLTRRPRLRPPPPCSHASGHLSPGGRASGHLAPAATPPATSPLRPCLYSPLPRPTRLRSPPPAAAAISATSFPNPQRAFDPAVPGAQTRHLPEPCPRFLLSVSVTLAPSPRT
ncbi:hypothetical protein VPH35_059637 [Triticum aestivum]